jgi:hypothetical protein
MRIGRGVRRFRMMMRLLRILIRVLKRRWSFEHGSAVK